MKGNANSNYFTLEACEDLEPHKANVNHSLFVPAQDPDLKMPITSQGYKDSPLWKLRRIVPQKRGNINTIQTLEEDKNMTNLKPGHISDPPT